MARLSEIRTKFIDYFKANSHEEVSSSSLVPKNDPTLMFTNSGMVQFKNVFTGDESRTVPRAVTSQKCVRAGGKHNDLDNVGYTARHHTFFEMLGNFSFGDYFKEKAIKLAWDLIIKELEIPKDRLLVTVFHDDEEAVRLWKKYAGLNEDRIIRIKTSDNFWSMGSSGPCGPCSEIFFDHGEKIAGGPPGSKNEDGDRFVEIWNLVFMQFDQLENGKRIALPKPSIDTGMGLERVAAILQGKHDNYDTDLFQSLIEESANISSTDPYGPARNHHRVIADHLRSSSFLIADGVMPSSEGRGYVLRRILRRAMRHINLMGINEPFIFKLIPKLIEEMGSAFPELISSEMLIQQTLRSEEDKFIDTLGKGMGLLEREISGLAKDQMLDGRVAFKLYDTYGFPIDLTEDALKEKGLSIDMSAYKEEMELQRLRARKSWKGSGSIAENKVWGRIFDDNEKTEFVGYEYVESEGTAVALVCEGYKVTRVESGESFDLLCNQTPFFGESGGQVGDQGLISCSTGVGVVSNVINLRGFIVHKVTITEGEMTIGQTLKLSVDQVKRAKVKANHSATHLLHEALRNNLGVHIEQKGSLNSDERLRFDFSHAEALSKSEIEMVQDEVNCLIRQNSPVETNVLDLNHAKELGARALFGEKYGDDVRVVSMGEKVKSGLGMTGDSYSVELCGGTHVNYTGDIGYCIIVSEAASASGIRRIEALTGQVAVDFSYRMFTTVSDLANYLKASPKTILNRVTDILEERRLNREEISNLKIKVHSAAAKFISNEKNKSIKINGIDLKVNIVENLLAKDLRVLLDQQKENLSSAIVIIFSESDSKVLIVVGVTSDLIENISAVDIAKVASRACGGSGGGGRRDFAQAGGSNPSSISKAIENIQTMLASQ